MPSHKAIEHEKIVAVGLPSSDDVAETTRQVVDIPEREATPDARPRIRARKRAGAAKWRAPAKPEYAPFANALRAAMDRLGLSASEVARRTWGTTIDARGRTVAKNRDRVGHYLAGTSYPEPDNLEALSKAVELPVEALAIERPAHMPAPRAPRQVTETLTMLEVPGQRTKTRLQVDQVVDWKLASVIYAMLKQGSVDVEMPTPGTVINGGKNGNGDTAVA